MVRLNTRPSGFTIVELLIVIVVIAILAAISIVAYNGIQQRAGASAQQQLLAQMEKEIMVYALQENGESISLGGTLVGYQDTTGESTLLRTLSGTPDITMYAVYTPPNTTGSYANYAELTPDSSSPPHRFALRTGASGSNSLGSRIDTSAQTNITQSISGYRVVGTAVIGWLQVSDNATVRAIAFNQAAAQNTGSLSSHSQWNFTGISLPSSGSSSSAALVFNAAHNEATRTQVIQWLAKKYNVSL